jgi:hypothetical protein
MDRQKISGAGQIMDMDERTESNIQDGQKDRWPGKQTDILNPSGFIFLD